MNQIQYSLVLLTYNAEQFISDLLRSVHMQSVPPKEIIVVDSSSTDRTAQIVAGDKDCRLMTIAKDTFRHGGTRHMAMELCSGDFVVFLTQDALLCDSTSIERLLRAFDDPEVAMAYGRQIAYPQADDIEKLFRLFNYPDNDRINTRQDIKELGVRAYFFSDTFSAYRMNAYHQLGGFDRSATTNEDMLMAYTALNAGWKTAYCSKACVRHSHNNTLRKQFYRSRETARFLAVHPELTREGKVTGEGLQLLAFTAKGLLRIHKPLKLVRLFLWCGARYMGHRCGLMYRKVGD